MIKMDKKLFRKIGLCACISGIALLFGILGMSLEISTADIVVYLLVGSILIGGAVLIYSALSLLCSLFYMHRLKFYGYEIPYDRKEYGNDYRNLPRNDEKKTIKSSNAESIFLTVFYLTTYLGTLIWNFWYVFYWYNRIFDSASFLFGAQFILDLFWLVSGLRFLRQCNKDKYRDDVELDQERKERVQLEKGLLTWIVILCVMFFAKCMVVNMSDYVYRSLEAEEQSMEVELESCEEKTS